MSELNIRKLPAPEPGLHAFETMGKITKADVEFMADALKPAFERDEEVDILIVMRDYDGIEVGAVFDTKALSAQAQSARHVRKYAVVGAPDWAETMINVMSPISPVEARTFDLEDEASAWVWVRER
ncbi:MAG: STAS/SEC14 domain-containing protein [Mesorhizobium sp.]|nr:STAS/SEC14 domain-containing protein [Mesorhizobium sp.]